MLTLRIEGQGNVTLLPRPAVTIPWANVVAADERVRLDSTPTAMRGSKEFDWLITPTASGAQRVPAVRYAFFNPFARRYEIAMSAPLDVRVAAGDVVMPAPAAAPLTTAAAPLALRLSLGAETPTPFGDSRLLRLWLALMPLPSIAGWVARRPRKKRRAPTAAAQLGAMVKAPAATVSAAAVRRLFLDAGRGRTRLHDALRTQPRPVAVPLAQASGDRHRWDGAARAGWATFAGYTRGVVIIAATNAALVCVALLLLRVPLALPLALLVFFAAFIPLIGSPIALAVATLVALAGRGPLIAVLVLVLIVVIGQIEGNLLHPMVMSRAVNLHPLAVALTVASGTVLAGVIGAVVAVPLVAVAWTIWTDLQA